MRDFDPVAYESVKALFENARKIRISLPSLVAQIADTVDMLGAAQLTGMPHGSESGNPTERKYIERIELIRSMENRRDEYRAVVADAEAIISNMELHDECYASDAAFLRYHYLQGMNAAKAAEKCGFAKRYAYEKREAALVNATNAAMRLGLA